MSQSRAGCEPEPCRVLTSAGYVAGKFASSVINSLLRARGAVRMFGLIMAWVNSTPELGKAVESRMILPHQSLLDGPIAELTLGLMD